MESNKIKITLKTLKQIAPKPNTIFLWMDHAITTWTYVVLVFISLNVTIEVAQKCSVRSL